jgi:preprotein translocase subunit SecY
MLEKLRVVFTIPELRNKILLTLLLLGVYRIGYQIRLPVLNSRVANNGGTVESFLEKMTLFAATDLRTLTIFGLGIMPYISASIIFQLLGTVWSPIERLRKEGQAGIRKINEYTRYLTVFICILQSWFFLRVMSGTGGTQQVSGAFLNADGSLSFGWQVTLVTVMTAGTMFLMWLGEQIDEYGIGNGISLLIMAGIVAQMPKALWDLRSSMQTSLSGMAKGQIGPDVLIVLGCLFIGVVFSVVFITLAQRRIPTQSAKHVRGRKVYGGTKQYLPLKINQSGVMPIIFASSLLMIPGVIFGLIAPAFSGDTTFSEIMARGFLNLSAMFSSPSSFVYNISFVLLIFFFCFFWTSVTFNPKEMSENLKDHGTFIPGYRPGKRTADFLEKVMIRITYVGGAFLAAIAIAPTIVTSQFGVSYNVAAFYGGTGLLIAVSVAFDLIQKIDSHLLMRNYKGLLES